MKSSSVREHWRFFYYTPLWDMLRGVEPYRMDWRGAIEQTALPDQLKEFLLKFVRSCWLWASERRQIALELIAHFEDGLAANRTADELIKDFGDLRVARRLMTRAKRRQRHWIQKVFWRSNQVLATLMIISVVLVVVQVLLVRTRTPSIDTNYWEQIQAQAEPAPETQSAWPLYRELMIKSIARLPEFETFSQALADPNVSLWLEEHQEWLDLGREASQREQMGTLMILEPMHEIYNALYPDAEYPLRPLDLSENPPLTSAILPPLVRFRVLGSGLALSALKAIKEGQHQTFVENTTAQLRVSKHIHAGGVGTIEHLIALEIYGQALDTFAFALLYHPELLDATEWRDRAHEIAALDPPLSPQTIFASKQRTFHDLVQRLYTAGPNGRPTPEFLNQHAELMSDAWYLTFGPVDQRHMARMFVFSDLLVTMAPSRGELEQRSDEWGREGLAKAAQPPWQRSPLIERRVESGNLLRHQVDLFDAFVRSLDRVVAMRDRAGQKRDALLATIALELFRREHNGYPDRLTALVPRWLPAVPLDLLNGQPIRYRLTDAGPLIYSVGVDGDDDQGRPVDPIPNGRCKSSNPAAAWEMWGSAIWRTENPELARARYTTGDPPDGDWILWPPPVE